METNDLTLRVEQIMKEREEQDNLFKISSNPELSDEQVMKCYHQLIGEKIVNQSIRKSMLEQIHSGNMKDQGKPINIPLDFMTGSLKFTTIYNGQKNDIDERIAGTEITQGMINFRSGKKWVNGLIAYSDNIIVVRDLDNCYGHPGFLSGCFFYDKLGCEIMQRYILPMLIRNCNEDKYNENISAIKKMGDDLSCPTIVWNDIMNTYNSHYQQKLKLLENENMTIDKLFEDQPQKEKLNIILTENDRTIFNMQKEITHLKEQLNKAFEMIENLEDMIMDKLDVLLPSPNPQ